MMTVNHDLTLVLLSIVIAICSSFTALSLVARVRAWRGWRRQTWLLAAGGALGGGIWSMHFVAMLAFTVPAIDVSYDLKLTLLSFFVAVAFTTAGFGVVDWEVYSPKRILLAGLFMGAGVVAMHYIGMAALLIPATITYDRVWLVVSLLIAFGAATAGVQLASRERGLIHQGLAAVAMGIAIAGMHYAGMQAAQFASTGCVEAPLATAGVGQTQLALLISIVTIVILLLALGAAQFERLLLNFERREARIALRLRVADILRDSETQEGLQQLATLLGTHFNVARTGYGTLHRADDVFDYGICWTNGAVPPLLGRFPAAAFGKKIVAALTQGTTVAIEDLLQSDLSDEELTRTTARQTGTRAILVVPFLSGGQLRTIVYLNDQHPRRWQPDDIAFLEEIADRCQIVLERQIAQSQLEELNRTLEARVEERTRELHDAQEQLLQSQKMEAVGQLVSGLAHDFNNVLGAVVGALELIQRKPNEPERVRKFAGAGLEAAQRGAKLTSQLLAFSRTNTVDLKPIALDHVIEGMRDLLTRTLGPMIALTFDLRARESVLADATQIEMMLLNLTINARDAMPGGGTLVVSTRKLALSREPDLSDGEYVEMVVQDTGVGMDQATARRAMEPFFTTKPVGKGTGLGLSQIYGSTRRFGGTVKIESSLGVGTAIKIVLPRTPDSSHEDAPLSSDVSHPPAPSRILLVDDDNTLRQLIATALTEHGHVVTQANSGPAALSLMESEAPDIAVLDFAMPDMTGAELASRILKQRPHLPILFASGYSDEDAIRSAVGSGATILRKPFCVERLLEAISTAQKAAS